MNALSRFQSRKEANGKAEATDEPTKAAKIIADAIRDAFQAPLGGSKYPPALEALAISSAGDGLKFPVGEQLANVAAAIETLAEQFERIADVLEAETDNGGKKK
jgi:hypothetical protein